LVSGAFQFLFAVVLDLFPDIPARPTPGRVLDAGLDPGAQTLMPHSRQSHPKLHGGDPALIGPCRYALESVIVKLTLNSLMKRKKRMSRIKPSGPLLAIKR